MATNNYNKYDEDFKKISCLSIKTVRPKSSSAKNTVSLSPPSANGSVSIPLYRSMTVKSSPPGR